MYKAISFREAPARDEEKYFVHEIHFRVGTQDNRAIILKRFGGQFHRAAFVFYEWGVKATPKKNVYDILSLGLTEKRPISFNFQTPHCLKKRNK